MSKPISRAQTRQLLLEAAGDRSVSDARRSATEHDYLFDAKLFAQFTVKAGTRKEPVVLVDGGVDLLEIDGEAV